MNMRPCFSKSPTKPIPIREIIKTAPHNSTVHQTHHEAFDDPDEWAVTWRAYLRKTGQTKRLTY